MKRFASYLTLACMMAMMILPGGAARAAGVDSLKASAEIAVFSSTSEKLVRTCGKTASLSDLSGDEYYTYFFTLRNNGKETVSIRNMQVSVDGSEKWSWKDFTLEPNTYIRLHVYYSNMKTRQTEGEHTVAWYIDGQEIHRESFRLSEEMDWDEVFPAPSNAEISQHNRQSAMRSPYLHAWVGLDDEDRFTEYSVDFRADMLPKATYLCLANMRMDLTPLKKRYSNVHTEYEYVNMYAGFQRRWTDKVSILSFWDIYYTDSSGRQQTLRAKRLYPEAGGNDSFTGEGEGAHTLVPYEWQEDKWYRMLLQSLPSHETGTTHVEQWVCDLESGEWTMLCRYDTGIPDSTFRGPLCFFLENFDNEYSGEVRTMEVCNVRVKDLSGRWRGIDSAYIGSSGGLPKYDGSYAYGSEGDRFWMITSGVGGDWYGQGRVPQNKTFYVDHASSDSPY